MTEPEDPEVAPPQEGDDDDDAVRALVRRALVPPRGGDDTPNLLRGVQRRIRRRSRGKFFGDGWSTGQARLGYLLVAAVTLLLVILAWLGMGPMSVR